MFEEPFEFISHAEVNPTETRVTHRWGGWTVIERFPAYIRWTPPSRSAHYLRSCFNQSGVSNQSCGGYPLLTNGLIQCPQCHSNHLHHLRWPDDAYWQWSIRGKILWAWDRTHAEAILKYIQATIRPPRTSYELRYIPTHFLSAKVRTEVARKMELKLKR